MAKAAESVGSDRAEMKKLLKLAVDKPIHMAFALGGDGKAIIKMEKIKPPRTIEKSLKEGDPDSKNHRFGMVMIDPENPKVAKFVVNKAVGGFARKLIIALKGTGFKKVQIVMEDGSAVEEAEGEDDEEEEEGDISIRPSFRRLDGEPERAAPDAGEDDGGDASGSEATPTPAAASGDDAPADPTAAPRIDPGDTPPDAGALTQQLTALVKQMLGVIKKDPSQKAALAELATDAQASLKRGDLDQASAGIEILRMAIADASGTDAAGTGASGADASGAGADISYTEPTYTEQAPTSGDGPMIEPTPSPAAGAPTPANGAANGSDGAAVQKLHKSRAAWTATRARIDSQLQKLSKAIMDASEGEDMGTDLESEFFSAVDPVLAELDETLSDTLSQAADASDDEERQQLLQDARDTIDRYTQFVAGNPIIAHLDKNPFHPTTIGKTLTGTLSTLSAIMR